MTADKRLSIGGNNPPEEGDELSQKLKADHSDILIIYEAVIAKKDDIPLDVIDDETSGKVSDYMKKLKNSSKMLNGAREDEKAPYLHKAGIVQNFFKSRMERIDTILKEIEPRLAKYLQAKKDEEDRRREEKAKEDAEEAAKKLREAQEKEREAQAALKRQQEEAARLQREQEAAEKARQEEAARIKREADAAAQKIRDEAAAEIAKKQAEIDRLNKEKADKEEADRKEHEKAIRAAEREKDEAEREARRKEREAAEVEKVAAKEVREIEKEGRAEARENEEQLAELQSETKQATRDMNKALDVAVRADKVAVKAERATQEKGSILSRTRGDESMASVSEKWVGEPISREVLLQDAAKLWEHIPFAALQQAVQAFVAAGGRPGDLKGARIYQETQTVVR